MKCMNQEEIINSIRKKCGNVERFTPMGWHFVCNGTHMIYMPEKNINIIRICIPHIVKTEDYDMDRITTAINETNREVKFIKVVILGNGSISINYDHKISTDDNIEIIIAHMIKSLDFASMYFRNKLGCYDNDEFDK